MDKEVLEKLIRHWNIYIVFCIGIDVSGIIKVNPTWTDKI